MTRVLIVEDEPYIRKGLIELIELLDKDLVIIGECGSVNEAIVVTNASKPDLIFLDINLPDGDAFDFIEKTNQMSHRIIFTTAHEKYALKALKKGAIDYILKPVDIEELETAVDKALASLASDNIKPAPKKKGNNKLILSLQDSFQAIDLQELVYCMSDKGYTTFYPINGKPVIASKPLKEFEDRLLQEMFVRPHQSYFVNMNYVDRYDKNNGHIIMKSGQKIPVSTRKKDEFLERFLNG
ncbi:LytR/AlgR family response regulator transcription factor [Reichenbachiella versicolor]|uniref:LytR/AlgR family response regulator transcription factor n=1 Tax=Reichenbachiella versicolor TaxID=1821036 RepID=UPI000D6DE941|nr:LytTR family DNA-binding domain-containing protein [Reichenbachiella versicolor]